LAGAFSDTAFMKLREVFQALFNPKDDRSGKLGLAISTTGLMAGTAGAAYHQVLQVTGGTAPLKWSVSPALPSGLTLDVANGTIGGTPASVSPKASYKFTVTDSGTPASSASADLALEIKPAGPTITIATLPDGAAGTLYKQEMKASGGTPPLKWAVTPALPASLTLDPSTGIISGTPSAASPKASYKFTVTDSAAPPLSSTATLTLEIK